MTAAEMFCERVLDGITNWDKPKTKQDEENVAKDELYEALVEDADTLPQGETLEEHDRKKHKGHFDPSTQTCKFRDEMKKETEADRADEISPESAPTAEGGEEGGQKKPLVSAEEDKAYMEAVERGDMDTAAKMVHDAAKTHGFEVFGLHGTKGNFTVFNKDRIGTSNDEGWLGRGFYFWDEHNRTYAYQYANGGKVMEVYLSMNEPYLIEDEEKETLIEAAEQHDVDTIEDFSTDVRNNGYDSVIDGDGQLMVFDPKQIKSADPVTYDDDGNIIPLSRRFDDGDDIRGDVSLGGDDKQSSVEQEESEDLESYDKNFTEDGEWKSPWNNGAPTFDTRKSVGVARNPWTKASRAEAEMAAQMLKRVLGGVTVGFSDKPYEGEGDTRKSIGGIFTGTSADYANESRQGGVGDGPSLMKIGSGEGSQVYGWGLYGSDQEGVALSYASNDALSKRYELELLINGKKSKADKKEQEAFDQIRSAINSGISLTEIRNNLEEVRREGYQGFSDDVRDDVKEVVEKGIQLIDHGIVDKSQIHRNIYEQTFFTNRAPGDESHLLNWYEPVRDEQVEWIQKKLKENYDFGITESGKLYSLYGATGADVYNRVKELLEEKGGIHNSPEATSRFLAEAGIDGVKYPVDSYGGKSIKNGNEAGWNYVSFRDDNIRVDHKWVDGEQRYFRNKSGKVVGEYDRNTNKITLYPGATVRDVVHEYSHGLWQFAEQEAEAGRGELLDKMKSIADTAPKEVKSAVAANYEEVTPGVYLEECFTHEMARRSDSAFAKAIESKQGKPWYKRAWGAIKDAWKGLATKMGLNKADISKIGKMSDGEAAEHILSQMMEGRRFGEVKKGQGDTRNSKSAGDTFELPNGTKVPANLAYLYKGMDGTPHNEKWSPFLEKTTGNGAISKDFSDVLDKLFSGELVDADTIKSIPEWKDAMANEKRIQDDLEGKHGVRTTAEIKDSTREKLRSSLIRAAMTDHITRTVPLEGFDGLEFETNEGLKDGESYDVEKGRVMTVVIGLPAAGKSTTFANPLAKKFKARLCDSDTVKKTLPEFSNGYGGNVVHEESTKINEEILKRSIEQGDNIVYPILGYKPDKLKKLFGQLREKGYKINLCLKDMPANIALGRLLGRFMGKGRYLPIECITKAMGKFGDCFEQVKDLVDAYVRATSDPDGTNERIIESKGELI